LSIGVFARAIGNYYGGILGGIHQLATIEDVLGLQERAAQLEQLDSKLRSFACTLGQLAGRFEPEQARALIARYLEPE
jgi:hypothetical protein